MNFLRITVALFVTAALSTSFAEAKQGKGEREVVRLSEPVEVTATHEVFGAKLDTDRQAVSLGELVADSERHLGTEVLLETRINKVCQKKGCFFIAQDGADYARVTFKDYGFFIPTDSAGKTVLLEGVFSRQELTREQADHFAADLGEARARDAAAMAEYRIVATAISVPKS